MNPYPQNTMLVDIKGKINEKKLAYNNTLLPLFEAVVNSIHAIEEDSATKPGIIKIKLIRSKQTAANLGDNISLPSFKDFIIQDNGIGFTERNYESFNFAHSTYKEKRGGKGIGRFVWLRAFQKAEIESMFTENDQWFHRKFNFEPTKNGIEKPVCDPLVEGTRQRTTTVKLIGLRENYQKWCNTNIEDIAYKIIEHCFIYFLRSDCPRIIITDEQTEIVVNDRFSLFTRGQVSEKTFKVRDESFTIDLVKIYNARVDNKIHYCANTREVQNEKMSGEIPELDTMITDENGDRFSVAVYIMGDYLDRYVNEERTQINFIKKTDSDIPYPNEVTQEEIRNAACELVRSELAPYLEQLSEVRLEKVVNTIHRHPQYKQLLKYKRDSLRRIKSNLTEDEMEVELFKIQQQLDYETKNEAKEILKFIDNSDDKEEFQKQHSEIYDKIIEVGNSKLSQYIIHRKLVLDLLDKHIKPKKDGAFAKEDAVHRLIFPLKTLSDDIGFEDHNLWVIDERLAYHKYLASDKKFKEIKVLNSASADRPDIIVFNKPFAFTNDEKPYSSVVLIEFKRPMRDDYSENENPINQINRYAGEIAENEAKDKDNRTLDIKTNTPIYAYIVCDLTKNLRKFARDAGYKPLPDNDGFFAFNDNYNLYIEIISFDKLIKDSKQRNKILFDKLNLPTN
nr:hypothetical protein [uncultured Mucilaginibacter sp.]